jgi:aspartate/glutamate racemase
MEGREAKDEREAARDAVRTLRARTVDAIVLGCTEIPLLLGDEAEGSDLISPAVLLADAAVRFAIDAPA